MCATQPSLTNLKLISARSLAQVWDGEASRLAEEEQRAHIKAVAEILRTNLLNRRYQRAVGAEVTDELLEGYGIRVADHYWTEFNRMADLEAGDETAWRALQEQLFHYARKRLFHQFNLNHDSAHDQAHDCAQEACQEVLRSRYPYDVPFDAWASRILANCIVKHMARSRDLLDQASTIELDVEHDNGTGNPSENVPDQSDLIETWMNRDLLTEAISQLPSESQRQVIILDFFYDLSDKEIATRLDKTSQAVYNLRYRALHGLRAILEQGDRA